MRAMQQGLHVYTQKPLTQTIYEARQLTRVAREKKLVTQMGIQIHSHEVHRTIVATIQAGTIGKVKEVHSWSGKHWGDRKPRPSRVDTVPKDLNWNSWLGVAAERPFLAHYYHPGEWRKRLDFGTGTFGDMGCHILDPVYTSLALTAPSSIRSDGGAPNGDNWGLDSQVRYIFPGTKHTTETLTLFWYDGDKRPPAEVKALIGKRPLSDQGSIYIGNEGVLYAPYIDPPVLLPADKFKDVKLPNPGGNDHYLQFVEACRGNGKTSAPFDYSGPLTESVLLGCLATRFPKTTLEWDPVGVESHQCQRGQRVCSPPLSQGLGGRRALSIRDVSLHITASLLSTSSVQYPRDQNTTGTESTATMSSLTTMATNGKTWRRGPHEGRLARAIGLHRRCDARHEPANRRSGDGPLVRHSGAQVAAGCPLALAEPAGARGALVPDHAVQHLDRGDRSLEAERPAAAPGRGFAGRFDLRRRAPADR